MRLVAALLMAALPFCAAAQTYKCTDKGGAVTYSNEACEKQGLKDAGKVRDRLTTMPMEPLPAKKAAAKAPEKPAESADKKDDDRKADEKKPAEKKL